MGVEPSQLSVAVASIRKVVVTAAPSTIIDSPTPIVIVGIWPVTNFRDSVSSA